MLVWHRVLLIAFLSSLSAAYALSSVSSDHAFTVDEPPEIFFSRTPYSQGEDDFDPDNPVDIYVALSSSASITTSVDYWTEDGSAESGQDYEAISGTLKFAPGEVENFFAVPIYNDFTDECEETFTVHLGNPVNGVIRTMTETVTVRDDDWPLLTITPVATTEIEADTTVTYQFKLSRGHVCGASVKYRIKAGDAQSGTDFALTDQSVVFAPGDTREYVTVQLFDDELAEPTEYVEFQPIVAVNLEIGTFTFSLFIEDDDVAYRYAFLPIIVTQ